MAKNNNNHINSLTRLESWKDISQYLKRDIRTCQRWEKELGMPVYRLEQSSRSRVLCYAEELDEWLQKKLTDGQVMANGRSSVRFSDPRVFFVVIPLVLFIASAIVFTQLQRPSRAVDFRLFDSTLLFLDEHDRVLGEFDTQVKTLEDETHYRGHFQKKLFQGQHNYLPNLIIGDIDANPGSEALFSYLTTDDSRENTLLCMTESGDLLWDFRAGENAVFGDGDHAAEDFSITGIDLIDVDHNGVFEILVISNSRSSFPSQVCLLDSNGKTLGTYWHAGRINDYHFCDVDQDGQDDIILAGANREFRKPCMVVLDPHHMNGSSPQNENEYRYAWNTLYPEKHYLLFPSKAYDLIGHQQRAIQRISLTDSASSWIVLENVITFRLDFRLELSDVGFNMRFLADYKDAERKGSIPDDFDLEKSIFEEGIAYHNGQEWAQTSTMNRHPGAETR